MNQMARRWCCSGTEKMDTAVSSLIDNLTDNVYERLFDSGFDTQESKCRRSEVHLESQLIQNFLLLLFVLSGSYCFGISTVLLICFHAVAGQYLLSERVALHLKVGECRFGG